MTTGSQEIEAKFYVQDLDRIQARLEELGSQLVQERVLETNIRFDLPGARLRAEGRVLRLRRDSNVRLTYKSASQKKDGVLSREEIEFTVEDFEKAKRFLEALGYQKMFYYEKYRTTYQMSNTFIMLDELPYGDFVEIEGQNHDSIHSMADQLKLDWDAAIAASYHALFKRTCRSLNRTFEDLSFENFAGMAVAAKALGVRAADR
ncbi:MAG TPA: class IV adenylate cyclase [Anaerolineales bacterium]|nr:class IV adenylate cyclase [Anaerolineales bacterium]